MPPCPHPCRSAPTATRPSCAASPVVSATAASAPASSPWLLISRGIPGHWTAMPLVLIQGLSDPACQAYSWEISNALEGMPREEAARLAGMTGQTLGDRVHRYNAEGVEGLRDRHRPGRPCALDEGQQAALKALVLRGRSWSATVVWLG